MVKQWGEGSGLGQWLESQFYQIIEEQDATSHLSREIFSVVKYSHSVGNTVVWEDPRRQV